MKLKSALALITLYIYSQTRNKKIMKL